MKKIIWMIVLIVGILVMTSCEKSCKSDGVCGVSEECRNGKCKTAKCYSGCPDSGSVCKYTSCGQGTNFQCEINNIEGSTSGCMGSVSGKHCMKLSCVEGECVQVTDTRCLEKENQEKIIERCTDGTETGECSLVKRGYLCNGYKQLEFVGEHCEEDYDERSPKKAPILETEPCDDGTPNSKCSENTIGYVCINQTLIKDETCLPEITGCSDSTLIGECSETKDGFKCSDEGELVEDSDCILEEPPVEEIVGCGDTPEGDCSDDGKWCIHGELMVDEACENQCDDGTPNWGCSFNTVGYTCEDGVLIEEPTCDPNYVYVPIDCDDGTETGYCNVDETHWCDQGVLVELGPDEFC
ncbi:hypothetical protein HOD20_06410 [archaeon]|nr:hypothetical protein [archaeon]